MAYDSCPRRCPGGRKCCLSSEVHELHICPDPDCQCHSAERYGARLAVPTLQLDGPARPSVHNGQVRVRISGRVR